MGVFVCILFNFKFLFFVISKDTLDEQGRPIDERPGFEILYKDFQDYGCDANGNWIETKNFKDYVDSKYNLDQNIIYIYSSGGVNPNIFYKIDDNLYNEIFDEFHLSVNKKYVAYVGRITKDKGWDIYCYALKKILENNNNIMGLIAGSGNEYQKLII